ncbi:hypothetical protein ACFQH8_15040 [Halomicroarcula sp. GCM10025710]
MAVLNALRRTPSALRRNPVVLVPILVISLFQVPQLALQAVNPLLSSVVSLGVSLVFLVVMPFFQGGMIGMADEALTGRTALQTFVEDGKSHYVSILVAYLALVAVNFALGMVAFFIALFGGIFVIGSGGLESANIAVLVVVGIIVAAVVLLYLLALFFVQFYGQAIVLEDMGAVDGLKHSVSVVRQHVVSVLGYSILVGILGGVFGGVFGILSLLLSPESAATLPLPGSHSRSWPVSVSSSLSSGRCSAASSRCTPYRSTVNSHSNGRVPGESLLDTRCVPCTSLRNFLTNLRSGVRDTEDDSSWWEKHISRYESDWVCWYSIHWIGARSRFNSDNTGLCQRNLAFDFPHWRRYGCDGIREISLTGLRWLFCTAAGPHSE